MACPSCAQASKNVGQREATAEIAAVRCSAPVANATSSAANAAAGSASRTTSGGPDVNIWTGRESDMSVGYECSAPARLSRVVVVLRHKIAS